MYNIDLTALPKILSEDPALEKLSVKEGDVISLSQGTLKNEKFLGLVIDKRMNIGVKVPEWLELQKKERKGIILRLPIRSDIRSSVFFALRSFRCFCMTFFNSLAAPFISL
mgnify:CR=1 FL=1